MAEMKDKQTQYRCNLHAMSKLFDGLGASVTEKHKELMKKTPFKHLFEAIVGNLIDEKRKRDQILDDMIGSFDKEVGEFKFGSRYYSPRRMDVKLILGIEDGTEPVGKVKSHGRNASEIGPKMFGNIKRISASLIKEKIREVVKLEDNVAIEDSVKLMCLLLFQSFFFSNTGSHIAWGYVYYVDNLKRLNSFDWCSHILKKLMDGLKKNWSYPTQVNGCTMLLLYWFCEHSTLMKAIFNGDNEESTGRGNGVGEGLNEKWIPRIKKWKMTQMESVIKKAYLAGMEEEMFNNADLTPTCGEETNIRSLKNLDLMVVEDSDVEDTISRDKAVIRTMAGKLKNSIVGIRNAHSRRSMSSSERNQHTKKVSPDGHSEARTEDWGGPSFSLFQNESQDILADVTVESGAIIALDEESDIRVVTWNMDNETSKEIEVCRTEGMQCSDDMDDENNKNNAKNEEQNRMIEDQRKQIEELQAVVSQLNVEIEAQSLIMRNFQNQMIDVEKLERTTKDDRAFCMKEMSVLRKENMDLTTALADAMAKIEIHEQRDIRKEEYATKMQDALDSIQSKLQVKEKEHKDACNTLLEKSRLITAFQSRAGALEKQVFAKQNEIEELKLRLVEQSNRIESLVRTVDARDKVISEQSERIEEMQRVIQNYDDVAISNQVHQITQLYAPVDEEEQNDIQRSSVADRVKERVIERKRVKDEHFEYADYKKLKASAVDLSKDDNNIRVRRKVRM